MITVEELPRPTNYGSYGAPVPFSTPAPQIDDVGAGYAGLQQILKLRPDILKLDMSLVRDVDLDPARRSLVAALVHFASETGARLVAEGIERLEEREALRTLGVDYGQGYLLGRPGKIGDAPKSVTVGKN